MRGLVVGLGVALAAAACSSDGATGTSDTTTSDTTADTSLDTLGPDTREVDERVLITSIPQTEAWTMDGLSAPVHVVRVEGNIPHIYAENRKDLGRVLGFVAARDRFFIMDLQRRLGWGEVGMLLGELGAGADRDARELGYRSVSERLWATLPADHAEYFTAYADGVNDYIAQVKAGEVPPPSEFALFASLLGYSTPSDMMAPFDLRSVMGMLSAVTYNMNWDTGDPGRQRKADRMEALFDGATDEALRKAGAWQIWDDLSPTYTYASAPTTGYSEGTSGKASGALKGRGTAGPWAPAKRANRDMLDRTIARLDAAERYMHRDKGEGFGSNTWAVAGSKTTDGAALVANDGHLPLSVPALFWHVGLNTQLFGGGDIHQSGLLLTVLPILAVGTNGDIAWGQVNPVSDGVDFYREEIQLDADGAPAKSLFDGEWRDLVAVDEVYDYVAVPLLDSPEKHEVIPRYETFDGRRIYSIEGDVVAEDYVAQAGETVVALGGDLIVPRDTDGDSVITAVSFDFTGFDAAGYIYGIDLVGKAKTVYEIKDHLRGQVGAGLYTAAADGDGNILYSGFIGVPCRGYLERDEDGQWTPGSDPTMLLDGTKYGAFEIPLDDNGMADDTVKDDPYRCVVPVDETPTVINPDAGYTANANNQPGPLMDDGNLYDDPHYLGGPWSDFRAHTISTELAKAIAENSADAAKMAEIQGNMRSPLGELFATPLVDAVAAAKAISGDDNATLDDWQRRLRDLYNSKAGALDEAAGRLANWRDAGYETPSGVKTFYHDPTAQDLDDSVATMIFNAWLPRAKAAVFDDERMGDAFRYSGSRTEIRWLHRMLEGRGADNPNDLACWSDVTEECVFFDRLGTDAVERADELLVGAMVDALTWLEGKDNGGFDTDDQSAWLWGLRHQTRMESLLADYVGDEPLFERIFDSFGITTDTLPLADDIGPGDPRGHLTHFPRGGDNYGVDAANPGFSGTRFTHGSGPVMRMVIALKDGRVWGENIIPGGQSGLIDSPFFADQAKKWLANETFPFRFHVDQVVDGAVGRELYSPAP